MAGADPRTVFKKLAGEFGLKVSSENRPGARTSRGTLSDHAVNRALDLVGPPERMAAFAHAVAERHPGLAKQLIYGGRLFQGGAWRGGRNLGHHDHVHVAWGPDSGGDELDQVASSFLSRGGGGRDDLDQVATTFMARGAAGGSAPDRTAPAPANDPLDRIAGEFMQRQPKSRSQPKTLSEAEARASLSGAFQTAIRPQSAPSATPGKARLQMTPAFQEEQRQAVAEARIRRQGSDPEAARREAKLGGLFPSGSATGGTAASMQTFGKAVFKTDDAANAAAAAVARQVRKRGAAALKDPKTYQQAAAAGREAIVDLNRETPPTAVRELFGLEKGKAGRLAYNAAAVADYVSAGLLNPSNLMVGPLFEAGAPIVKGAVKLTGKALLRGAERAAPRQTAAAIRAVKVAGEKLGVGAEARAGREAKKAFDIDLGTRMQDAGQIVREARDQTLRLRKKSPAFDQAERAFAQQNGGKSRLQHLTEKFVIDPGGALKEATQLGVDPALVGHFGKRARVHANETLARLQKRGVQVPAAERGQFRQRYTEQMFRGSGTIDAVKQSAVADLTEMLVASGSHVAPVTPGQPLRPGWGQVPADPKFGKLAGMQAPKPIIRLIEAESVQGPPPAVNEMMRLGQQMAGLWTKAVGAVKVGYIANPATLSMNMASNAVAAQLGAARAKVNPARIIKTLPAAVKEVAEFARTGQQSADIAEFSRYSRGFLSTEASTIGLAAPKGAADVAGTSSRIFRMGTAGPAVHIPPMREMGARALGALPGLHGSSEQIAKLSLYKALKGKVGPEKAAALVDQHLFDYQNRHHALELLDRLGVWAFNTFPIKSLELALDTIQHRPDLLLRYPRLARLVRQDMGAEQEFENLPENRQGPLSVPLGDGRFADLSRAYPFADVLAAPDTIGRIAREGVTQDDLLALARRALPSAAIGALLFNKDPWGRDIEKPGLPPGEGARLRRESLAQSYLPPLISRQIPSLAAAAQGKPARGGALAEPESLGEAISRNVFGVPITRAETFEGKKERLAETTDQRAEIADEWLGEIAEALDEGGGSFPERDEYLRAARAYKDFDELQKMKRAAEARLWELKRDASIFANGEVTEAGKARLRRLQTWIWALGER